MRYRSRAIDALGLAPGEVVVDVACGTGINFPELVSRVGQDGRVIGVDLSADMLGKARERVARNGWSNVTLVEASIESAEISQPFDAALFSLTHDVMRSRAAIETIWRGLRAGGRVAVLGPKWAPRWAVPVNLVVAALMRPYTTTYEGLTRPWSHLEEIARNVDVRSSLFGAFYLATAQKS